MIQNLSIEELETLYNELLFKLKEPFPQGTVEFKKDNVPESAYVPTHPIQHRVSTTAGPFWSWRITTPKPIYHEEDDLIEVRGELTILTSSVEGQGFASIDRFPETKKIKFYKESIRAATSDAFRDAADVFGIGHRDLAPYRKWAKNPGAGLIVQEDSNIGNIAPTTVLEVKKCIKCGVVMTQEDHDYLKMVQWTNQVCKDHVPDHQKKKFPNFK